jgi:hypothetical protein
MIFLFRCWLGLARWIARRWDVLSLYYIGSRELKFRHFIFKKVVKLA